jgi:hypothetical protein
MATHLAIATTSEAIVELLRAAYNPAEFDGVNAAFELYQPNDFKEPMKTGVSLFLYRVEINGTLRNRAPRLAADGRYRPSLPVDLHYLLTPWAETASFQQLLLGWSMRVLEDTPILPSGVLNARWPDTFEPGETVELVAYQLSLADMLSLWDVLKPNQQPSVAYVARMVLLDSPLRLTEHAPVQTRVFGYGKVPER